MNPCSSSLSSPKRKRGHPSTPKKPSPSKLSSTYTATSTSEEEPGAESPRTQVTNRFESLQLDGGGVLGGVSKLDFTQRYPQLEHSMDGMEKVRKRTKFVVGGDKEIPETPQSHNVRFQSRSALSDSNEMDPALFTAASFKDLSGGISKSYPSINRLSDSVSRGKKRLGDSPTSDGDVEAVFVDPDRASLTWHDDEITGFDPDDSDDDGEGINGVGFRPTAARVELRAQKKRQQLADYRSRESREARSKRFERRRGSTALSSNDDNDTHEGPRKVRFSEVDAAVAIP